MCDNICVDLDKSHWVDCNECADGYVGRYGDPRNGCVASGYDPDPEPRPGQNLMSAWARTREYVAMTAYR